MNNTLLIKILLTFGICTSESSARTYLENLEEKDKTNLYELYKISKGSFKKAQRRGATTQ